MANKGVTLQEIQKQVAYMNHKAAVNNANICGLPYRICLDELKDTENNNVFLNEYYPLPGIPPLYKWHHDTDGGISSEQWRKMIFRVERNTNKASLYTPPIAIQGQKEKARPCKLWDLETDHGRQYWLYWFGAYIMPYADRLKGFTVFDMYGDTNHTREELKRQQAQYDELIKACTKKPDLYRHGVVEKADTMELLQNEFNLLSDKGIYPELLERIGDIITALHNQATTSH